MIFSSRFPLPISTVAREAQLRLGTQECLLNASPDVLLLQQLQWSKANDQSGRGEYPLLCA